MEGRRRPAPRRRLGAPARSRRPAASRCSASPSSWRSATPFALGLATPQNNFDTVFDHLWRAAVWRENQAVGYPDCDCAPYVNAYPPHGEMGVLATMVLGGSDRFAALVQAAAFVALAVGVVGVAARASALAPRGAARRPAGQRHCP